MQINRGALLTTRAVKGNGFLGQPLKGGAVFNAQLGMLGPGDTLTVGFIEFVGGRRRQQRLGAVFYMGLNSQRITAHQPSRRVQQ
eukprot:33181-Eustigmatos_ZCMA.PRE.1